MEGVITTTVKDILIVDDSADDAELIERLFCKSPTYRFTHIDTCTKAFSVLSEKTFDCLLLDYRLPDKSGLDFIRQVRKRDRLKFIPIIMMTGYGDERVATQAMKYGSTDYISKKNLTKQHLEEVIESSIKQTHKAQKINEKNQDLNLFAHTIAHDMTSPLRTILYAADSLESTFDEKSSSPMVTTLHSIHENAKTLSEMIGRLYNACLEGREKSCSTVSLNAVLKGAINLLDQQILNKSAKVVFSTRLPNIYGQLSPSIQVFQNLIINSLKFSHPHRTPFITIKAKELKDQVVVTFADNGIGVKDKQIMKVFNTFEKTNDNNNDGMGLGLAICKMAMKQQGGDIKIVETSEKGTKFILYFRKDHSI